MAFTYDTTGNIGKIRLMIPDRVEVQVIFQDDELDAFLSLEGDSLKRATALAIETIATDEALVQKVMENQGLKTDGAKLSDALIKRAKMLREQAALDDTDEVDNGFAIASFGFEPFGNREIIYNDAVRRG